MPSTLWLRRPARADNHRAKNSDHRDDAAAEARHRAASQQLPQPREPGQWCPVGWVASGSYCVPGSDKAPAAIPKKGWCPAGWRESGSYCIR
jgi:hypothetical protein